MEEQKASKAERFLNLYKELEDVLEQRNPKSGRQGTAVMDFAYRDEGAAFREDLNTCREVRNLLSHHPDMNGEAIVEPSDALIHVLEDVLAYIRTPKPAIDFATPRSRLLISASGEKALSVMRAMQKEGYSHVPVFRKGQLAGVFSISTVFSYVLDGEKKITENTRIFEFGDLLKLDKHASERFAFIGPQADYWTVRELFNRKPGEHSKRLAILFITKNGRMDGKILGIVTPWDLIAEDPPIWNPDEENAVPRILDDDVVEEPEPAEERSAE